MRRHCETEAAAVEVGREEGQERVLMRMQAAAAG